MLVLGPEPRTLQQGLEVTKVKTPYDRAATLRVWTGIGEVIPSAV
jgi:hypothetical protein